MRALLRNPRILLAAAVIGSLLGVAFWPRATPVDVAAVTRGPLALTVDEEAMTRVRDRFVVSSPVAGRVLRIDLEPGDVVKRGQIVARIRPEVPPLLDHRSRAEALAAVDAATAALGRARAEEQRARAAATGLQRDLARVRELARSRVVSSQELDAREADARVADESVNAAMFAVRLATSELARAQARLTPAEVGTTGRVLAIDCPVDGVVLKRIRESESVLPPGDALLEIGDPLRLEIVTDLLSTDAVRVQPGQRAIVEQWGGNCDIHARVRRVEPAGFTKISALGVEEQRVNVILDFITPCDVVAMLGDGYRVEVRIVVWEGEDVVKVPTSALFRDGPRWAVYAIERGRARRTVVEIGHQTADEAEVTAGVSEGDRVIVHPGDALRDGSRVAIRPRLPR